MVVVQSFLVRSTSTLLFSQEGPTQFLFRSSLFRCGCLRYLYLVSFRRPLLTVKGPEGLLKVFFKFQGHLRENPDFKKGFIHFTGGDSLRVSEITREGVKVKGGCLWIGDGSPMSFHLLCRLNSEVPPVHRLSLSKRTQWVELVFLLRFLTAPLTLLYGVNFLFLGNSDQDLPLYGVPCLL